MDAGKPKKMWWRRKRWWPIAVLLIVLPVFMPFFARDLVFLAARGELSEGPIKRLILFGLWSPAAPGPASWYQRRLQSAYAAGESYDDLEAAVREVEVGLSEETDPETRKVRANVVGSMRLELERRKADLPFWAR